VIGHSDADIVMSIGRGAPPGGYVVGWVRGDPNVDGTPRVTAVNLAGDSADLSAWHGDLARPVNWFGDAHGEPTEVDGREAVFVLLDEGEGGPDHVLLSRMENGSLLVLTSSGDQLLSREQLVASQHLHDRPPDGSGRTSSGGPPAPDPIRRAVARFDGGVVRRPVRCAEARSSGVDDAQHGVSCDAGLVGGGRRRPSVRVGGVVPGRARGRQPGLG
jgi:hypothetical protein